MAWRITSLSCGSDLRGPECAGHWPDRLAPAIASPASGMLFVGRGRVRLIVWSGAWLSGRAFASHARGRWFDSTRAHHSTRIRRAHGATDARSWRAIPHRSCGLSPARSKLLPVKPTTLSLLFVLVTIAPAWATTYLDMRLHGRVQWSDVVVLAKVADSAAARMDVERVLKGAAPAQITLVDYVDGLSPPSGQKQLVPGARELLFLRRKGDAYAPLQDQYGRMVVNGDRLIDSFRTEPRSLSQTLSSIERLVALQVRAAREDSEADQAYIAALATRDPEVQLWALWTSHMRLKVPSPALADAVLAHWKNDTGIVPNTWPHDAGMVANAMITWRLRRAAPVFAETLKTSNDGERRAFAAMAVGGTGDVTYVPLLREVSSRDAHANARALSYRGLMYMLGPDSIGDLRRGAKDPDEHVRAQTVVDAYNLLELGQPDRRWPAASSELIATVRQFLNEMQRDPSRRVSDNARSMLAMIARQRP